MKSEKEIVLITGAGSGMGMETALLFGSNGYTVIGVDIDENNLEKVVKKINDANGTAFGYKTNVVDPNDLKKLSKLVDEKFNKLDILINCVGVFGGIYDLIEISEEQMDLIIDVNLKSVYRCCKYLLPLMIKKEKGLVINIASMAGKLAHGVGGGIYGAAKWGVIGFSQSLDLQFRRKHNIKVSVINPGTTNTPFHNKREKKLDESLLKRLLNPYDIARACLFVAQQSDICHVKEIDVIPASETVEIVLK